MQRTSLLRRELEYIVIRISNKARDAREASSYANYEVSLSVTSELISYTFAHLHEWTVIMNVLRISFVVYLYRELRKRYPKRPKQLDN